MQLILSSKALDDIADILLYTLQTWGEAQAQTYGAAINKTLTLLSANPELGRKREEIHPGCRSYRVQQHSIYYVIQQNTIIVSRVLHNKMDARRHVQPPEA
jgi:toxin ParE1/3/4